MASFPLNLGDRIGVMAPSSYVEREDIEKSVETLEKRGYKVFVHPQTYLRDHQSAGTHEDKLEALYSLYRDPDIKVIWAAGGGNRALHILDKLDYDLIKSHPKPMIGFSDVTALLNAIYIHCGITNYHGPVFRQLHSHKHLDHALALLNGNEDSRTIDLNNADVINGGIAKGPLIGGNLSLFQYLPQTLPDNFWQNAILLLEDCNEELSRIDRMLLHLRRLGVLGSINGLVLGEFTHMKESGRPFGYTLLDLVQEHTKGLDIPIVANAPFGHGKNLYSLTIGANCELNMTKFTLSLHCS